MQHSPLPKDETLAPYITRTKRSRPNSSVPNKYPSPGGCSLFVTSMALGSVELKIGTNTASSTINTNPTNPIISAGFARSFSFFNVLCSRKIASLAAEILFRRISIPFSSYFRPGRSLGSVKPYRISTIKFTITYKSVTKSTTP